MFQTRVVEKIKTHFMCNNFFLENCAVYEVTWKNIVRAGRPQMTIWRMGLKDTHAHSKYVIRIVFPL